MKHNPEENILRERMTAGALSRDGFLDGDDRNIADIIATDAAELTRLGVKPAELAEFLNAIHQAADDALETETQLFGGRLTTYMQEGMGRIPCPFACGHVAHKGLIHVRTVQVHLLLAPLQIHLIAAHGFFQGAGSEFRLDPAKIVELMKYCMCQTEQLNQQPGKSHKGQ